MRRLNVRQERFIREVFKNGGEIGKAYRTVYNPPGVNSHYVSACRTLKKPHVLKRYEQLKEAMIKKGDITVDSILNEYEEARKLARDQENPANMMAASEKKAKIVGLLVDRKEVTEVSAFDKANDISEILELVAKEAGTEAALALSKAFGLTAKEEAPPEEIPMISPGSNTVN